MFATTLTTDRLTLRPFEISDAEAIFDRYGSDPEVTQFLSWPTSKSIDETLVFLKGFPAPTARLVETNWALCLKNDPLPWGGLAAWKRGTQVEIGYCLARSLWGQGLVTEATTAIMEEAWRQEDVWRVWASCHPDNRSSTRVMEKCGMRFEGKLRRRCVLPQISNEPQDSLLYAQVRDDL